ncbi:GWxTD domain-containing protein [candidate division WOR-3 bacterium]|nr:GWxTD domain-containing protein [candidate division WOR-3 bacterium]
MIFFILCSLLEIDFNFTTGSFLNNKGTPELRIFYEIPRNKLAYIKLGDRWLARFQFSCSLVRDKKEIGDTWVIEDSLKDYEATLKKDFLKGELRILVPPGDYEVKVCVRDLNSQRIGEKVSQITIKDLRGDYPQQISAPRFIDEYKKKILSFEIYNFSKLPFTLNYKIDEIEDSINFDTQDFVNPALIELLIDSLGFGTKIITLKVGKVQIQDTLYIKEPFWIKNYEKRVKELYYIAESQEIDSLLNVPLNYREEQWKEFWTRKDSIFGTQDAEEQYFRRIDYAKAHFSGIQDGWKTDRGRVYIKLDKPDEVESHPFEINEKPYEIWYYYSRNLKFIFVDKLGFGNYELEYPKYWQGEIQFK